MKSSAPAVPAQRATEPTRPQPLPKKWRTCGGRYQPFALTPEMKPMMKGTSIRVNNSRQPTNRCRASRDRHTQNQRGEIGTIRQNVWR